MTPLAYHRPTQLSEATALLATHVGAQALAGGQSLLAAMKLGLTQPTHLIDLQDIAELHDIQLQPEGLWIGAMVTHAQVANSAIVRGFNPMLCQLAAGIADPQVRHVGTLGGSLANNDPAACWPAGVLAMGATIHTTQQPFSADVFFTGLFSTALPTEALITGVLFPRVAEARYLKFEQPASRFALTGVAVTRGLDQQVRIAITGLGHGVMRWHAAEQALQHQWCVESLNGLQPDVSLALSDVHASATYRAHLAAVLCRRAVAETTGESPTMPSLQALKSLQNTLAPNAVSTIAADTPNDSLHGEHSVPGELQEVWHALLNPDVLQTCLVGCQQMRLVAPHQYQATIKVGLGPVSATFQTQVQLEPIAPPQANRSTASCRLQISGNAGALGQGQALVHVQLQTQAQGHGTRLTWQAQPQLQGRLAQLGNRLIQASAQGLSHQFFQRFTQHMSGEQVTAAGGGLFFKKWLTTLVGSCQRIMLRLFRR